MVKFAILAPILTFIRTLSIVRLIVICLVFIITFNMILIGNPELNYLIQSREFEWVDIITSLRYTKLISNYDTILYRLDDVRYFEMDLVDSYMMLGLFGLIACGLIYRNIYLTLRKIVPLGLIVVVLVYSMFFGHVVSSTSLGLMLIYLKVSR